MQTWTNEESQLESATHSIFPICLILLNSAHFVLRLIWMLAGWESKSGWTELIRIIVKIIWRISKRIQFFLWSILVGKRDLLFSYFRNLRRILRTIIYKFISQVFLCLLRLININKNSCVDYLIWLIEYNLQFLYFNAVLNKFLIN